MAEFRGGGGSTVAADSACYLFDYIMPTMVGTQGCVYTEDWGQSIGAVEKH